MRRYRRVIFGIFLTLTVACPAMTVCAVAADLKKAPPGIAERLDQGATQKLIVLFDDSAIEREVAANRSRTGIEHDDDAILAFRASRYRELKSRAEPAELSGEVETVKDYSHLPMSFKRFKNRRSLEKFLALPEVTAVYENRPIYPTLAQSLPLIKQPATAGLGLTGSGATVAVIDTGINYTLAAFGSCTAPGTPAGCRIAASVDITGNNVTLNTDPNGHGTNVAGIVSGVAPGARIAAINAFTGGASSIALIIDGINWAIANRSAYNIVAINMSLGDGAKYTAPCGNSHTNPFVTPVNNARAVGILPVAASGNEGYSNGIASPACTPGVASVGAVYDANVGGRQWSTCTDSTTAADQVACFSNSSSFVTMLSPGAIITAAGIGMGGTSQASPHVAGAAAVFRSAFAGETPDQTLARLTGSGVPVTDPRNGVVKPRLNLLAALGAPINDNFSARQALSGDTGQLTGNNANATVEPAEPAHAGNSGGRSVWWSWTPSVSGPVAIDTQGSSFDTLLAVYTGTGVTALTPIAANDNDGAPGNTSGLSFVAQAGIEYLIAVDGFNGAFGSTVLNWGQAPSADLFVTMTGSPDPLAPGETLTYSISVANRGPATAVNTTLTDTLPTGVSVVSTSAGCTTAGGIVTCNLGSMASATAVGLQIAVSPASAGTLTNTVNVASDTYELAPADNSAGIATTVSLPPPAVPALSPWGIALAACLLSGWQQHRKRRKPN
ncbi:IPTL-CTERM sorting domain-containing protein [Geotalea uraniireducens]|uniref:Conserved repeat domain protein n=1 Tax=Geotalea uraniireducens (strain Rf4) TaxID=351605 RepID=A5G4Q8_GEOUR|nr:IPTL-CTERM sorting domain-containing protein [Geotalea uraniireducens]ABQ26776.1 conserved repeat domain protein [Geotalea uraniireducens Rf4]